MTKSKFISKILEGYRKEQIKKFSKEFADFIFLKFKNKKIYNIFINSKKKGYKVYIVTASADFYCKFIAKLFEAKLISTKVNLNKKEFGNIIGKNCFGKEKKKRVLKEIKNFKNKYSILYTDSRTDIPLLKICKKGHII
jgi:HAD superfamily phosphoserine phosphatase-like hydrolase